jgi:hypothetical protein
MRFKKILIVILLMMSADPAAFAGLPVHFTGVRPTLTSCEYAGKVSIDGITAVSGEDEIAVFVKSDFGQIPVGAAVMGQSNAGDEYYFVSVYADDATTPEKDGAAKGEKLIFKFWDKSQDKEYVIPPAAPYMTYDAEDEEVFLTPPAVPPVWTNESLTPLGLLNLAMPLIIGDTDGSGSVDLKDAVLSLQIAVGVNSGAVIYRDADCNGDGRIGMEDALYVLHQLYSGVLK